MNNVYTLKNPKSGKCLAIPSASTEPGIQAIIWTCNGGSEQKWLDHRRRLTFAGGGVPLGPRRRAA